MSYLVLARKYRPKTFSEVVGQQHVINVLQKAFTSGRIAHAFLLTGSRGIGKTTVARLIAKALVCEKPVGTEPCLTCVHCKEVAEGCSLNVIEIDGASNTGVDDVRELRESIRYQPASAKFKVYIIDEVHMLSNNAFNALLKTLEEPPAHVKFILATTEPHKIPITVLSRCQRYDFKRLSCDTIKQQLNKVLAEEKISLGNDIIDLIAKSSEGGMRDALSQTDQVLSFANEEVTLADAAKILGTIDGQSVFRSVRAICKGDVREGLLVVKEAYEIGFDLKDLIEGIATYLRHLNFSSQLGTIEQWADLGPEDVITINTLAKEHDSSDLQRLFAMALDSIDQVTHATDARLTLELCVIRMCDRPKIADTITISNAIARLEALAKTPIAAPTPIAHPPSPPALNLYESRAHAEIKAKEELKVSADQDPLVRKALEIFGGEIKSIRKPVV